MLNRLGQMHYPIPKPLQEAASSYLDLTLNQELRDSNPMATSRGFRDLRARPNLGLSTLPRAAVSRRSPRPSNACSARSTPTPISPRSSPTQQSCSTPPRPGAEARPLASANQLLDAYVQLTDSATMTPLAPARFASLAVKLNMGQHLLGWRP